MRRSTAHGGRAGRRALLAFAVVAVLLAGVAASLLRGRRGDLTAPDVPRRPDPAPAVSTLAALMALSRDELYARARERGVPGRSRMTKRQLAEALAQPG